MDGVIGQIGRRMDLAQPRVGNVEHRGIHIEDITKHTLVLILVQNMVDTIVQDVGLSTNTSNVTHITVKVSTIDLKSQNNTCKTYLSNK